jgi:dihydroflavonol-4-reductase
MRAFVTGATGFIGGRLAEKLRDRGDEVVALVRTPAKGAALRYRGCELVEGDLGDTGVMREAMRGCDAAFHVAAVYKVGIRDAERPAMFEANVGGTERVIDAAVDAGVGRIVYVSTVGVFGNTHGRVVDESYERPPGDWLTAYDETKYLAHRVAVDRARAGAPVVIAMPGGVYGPGDHSDLATFIDQVRKGRLRFLVFPDSGFNFVHVEDATDGILLVHERGKVGESYVLGGELATVGDFIRKIAVAAGRRPPTRTLPPAMIRMAVPFGPAIARLLGTGPNLREAIRAVDGVTYWARHDRAVRELGYAPRGLDAGLPQTLAALPR